MNNEIRTYAAVELKQGVTIYMGNFAYDMGDFFLFLETGQKLGEAYGQQWKVIKYDLAEKTAYIKADSWIHNKVEGYGGWDYEGDDEPDEDDVKEKVWRYLNDVYYSRVFSEQEKAAILEFDREETFRPFHAGYKTNPREPDWTDYDCMLKPVLKVSLDSDFFRLSVDSKGIPSIRTIELLASDGVVIFANPESCVSVSVPDGVVRIDKDVFSGFQKLTEVTLPSGLFEIGSGAFRDCRNLKTAVLPDSLCVIGKNAFHNCTSLRDVKIPSGVFSSEDAFSGCAVSKESDFSTLYAAGEELTKREISWLRFCRDATDILRLWEENNSGTPEFLRRREKDIRDLPLSQIKRGRKWCLFSDGTLLVYDVGLLESYTYTKKEKNIFFKLDPWGRSETVDVEHHYWPWEDNNRKIKAIYLAEGITSMDHCLDGFDYNSEEGNQSWEYHMDGFAYNAQGDKRPWEYFQDNDNSRAVLFLPKSFTEFTNKIVRFKCIYGYRGSAAQRYCEEHGLRFKPIDEA